MSLTGYEILGIQIVGLSTLASYVYYLPKIDQKVITANMPNSLSTFSLISVGLAIMSYGYIMYNFIGLGREKNIQTVNLKYLAISSIALFLISSSFWAPSMYYGEKYATVSVLMVVAFCSIIFGYILYASKKFTDNKLLILATGYLIFHTLFVDGILWNYYYLNM